MSWFRRWLNRNRLQHTYVAGNQWVEWYFDKKGYRHITREYMAEPPRHVPPAPQEAKWR